MSHLIEVLEVLSTGSSKAVHRTEVIFSTSYTYQEYTGASLDMV